ncbi:MAG: dephospho-CoA kinase [Candidatus Omnitrophota bacterium]|jgi:dephospho-CoA kinase
MKIIGLTGSFGTGKTFVASVFKSLGAVVIDADRIAHECIKKRTPVYKRILRKFGRGVLNSSGSIDRAKLGRIVFNNKDDLKSLNRIVHPEVIKIIEERIKSTDDEKIIVIDAPLLVEAGLVGMVDMLVVVTCSKRKQIARCRSKFGIEKEEISKRIRNQVSIEKKKKMSDLIIENSGTRVQTIRQVREAWGDVWR